MNQPDLLTSRLTELVKSWRCSAARDRAQAQRLPGQRTNHQLYDRAMTYDGFAQQLEEAIAAAPLVSPPGASDE